MTKNVVWHRGFYTLNIELCIWIVLTMGQKWGYLMRNVKSTVLGTFSVFIVISLLSSAISFLGYTKVIDSVNNIKANKSNQDKLLQLNELASKRQQILTQIVMSMNDEQGKEFETIGKQIDSVAKELSQSEISNEDNKMIEQFIDINSKYNDTYTSRIAPDIKAFENTSIAKLSTDAQKDFEAINNIQTEVKAAIVDQLTNKIDNAIDDIIDLNRRVGLIYKDSQYVDSEFSEIKKLLSDILIKLQNSNSESPVMQEELNKEIEDLKERITVVSNSAKMILDNSQPVNGLDRVNNIKRISAELQTYIKVNQLISAIDENNSNIMYSAATFEDTSSSFKNNAARIEQLIGDIEKSVDNEVLAQLSDKYNSYSATAQDIYNRTAIMKKGAISNGYNDCTQFYNQFNDITKNLREAFDNYFAEDIQTSENIKKAIFFIFVGITVLSIVVGMIIALVLSKKIARPISLLASTLARVEEGDLTVRANLNTDNDIGDLGKKVNRVLDGQQKMVEQFKGTSNEISSLKQKLVLLVNQNKEGMKRISGYNINKSQEKKKIDTSTIITDVKIVSEQTQKAVGDSIKAIQLAKSREKTAEEAEQVINTVNETVKSIASSISKLESSSGKIGEITNTITQIASQTNLLALNAAIEANRAGEQGKGFAVVADEIRKLANASNHSASEIKTQIKEIQASISVAVEKMNLGVVGVENGASRINDMKEGISEIIHSVNMVANTIKESADKAGTHYESTLQFVEAIDSINNVVNEAAATDENINAIVRLQAHTVNDLDEISTILQQASNQLASIYEKVKI